MLTRTANQRVYIDTPQGRVTILVMDVQHEHEGTHLKFPRVRLGIEAPHSFVILREELANG